MDFALTDDQVAIQDAARAFAEGQLAPHSAEWDEKKHFPVDVLRQAAELGFAGIYVREDVGGTGLSRLDASIIFEALSYGDVSTAAYLTIHNMASWMIDRFGSDDLGQRYLPRGGDCVNHIPLADFEWCGAKKNGNQTSQTLDP